MYSWVFADTYSIAGEDESLSPPVDEATYHDCIRALYMYHFNPDFKEGSVNSDIIRCSNCTRSYTATRIADSNLLLVLTDASVCNDPKCVLPSMPYMSVEIADPVGMNENCTAEVRYRKRLPCYDTNPNVNMTTESYCESSSHLSASFLSLTAASLAVIFQYHPQCIFR